MKNLFFATTLATCSGMMLAGCQSTPNPSAPVQQVQPAIALTSIITSVDGSNTPIGQLNLRPVSNGMQIFGQIEGLKPNNTYALHIHSNGYCTNGGKDAGGHFNPLNKPHGHPDSAESHIGDLPNITTDENGIASVNYVKQGVAVDINAPTNVYHRAFIIHEGADDYTSQPSGDAGSRIACGIIDVAVPVK